MNVELIKKTLLSGARKAMQAYPEIAKKKCTDLTAAEIAKVMKAAYESAPKDMFVKSGAGVIADETIKSVFVNGKFLSKLVNWGAELQNKAKIFTKKGTLTKAGKKVVAKDLVKKGLSANATLGQSVLEEAKSKPIFPLSKLTKTFKKSPETVEKIKKAFNV